MTDQIWSRRGKIKKCYWETYIILAFCKTPLIFNMYFYFYIDIIAARLCGRAASSPYVKWKWFAGVENPYYCFSDILLVVIFFTSLHSFIFLLYFFSFIFFGIRPPHFSYTCINIKYTRATVLLYHSSSKRLHIPE